MKNEKTLSEEEIEKLWVEEALRRNEEIDQGKAKLIPGEEVFRKLKAKYK
jgi:hypothetical protein